MALPMVRSSPRLRIALLAASAGVASSFGRLETAARKLEGAASSFLPEKRDFSGCVDADTHCVRWAKTGECDSNPGFMRSNCRASCQECESDACHDGHVSCAQWAEQGALGAIRGGCRRPVALGRLARRVCRPRPAVRAACPSNTRSTRAACPHTAVGWRDGPPCGSYRDATPHVSRCPKAGS